MKKIILQKTRYLKALMLTMLVGFFAFEGNAQYTVNVQPNSALDHYIGRDSLVNYDFTPSLTGSTVYLHVGTLTEDNVLGTGGTGTNQTINFTWPDEGINQLFLTEATGTFDQTTEVIPRSQLTAIGANDGNYPLVFDQSGGRTVTTAANDLTGQTVALEIDISGIAGNLNDSLFVSYSTNGTSFTNLDTIRNNQTNFTIDLPTAAISGTTSFRIQQKNSGSIAAGFDTWTLDELRLKFGEGLTTGTDQFLGNYPVEKSQISLITIEDDGGNTLVPNSTIYPRDTLSLIADAFGFDKADYDYVAYVEGNVGGNTVTYQLDNQVADLSRQDSIVIEGSIPLNIPYGEDWNFYIKAFDSNDAEAVIGTNYVVNIEETQLSGSSTEYSMDGTDKVVESGVYLDPGGSGEYANNINNLTETLYPESPNGLLRLDFVFTVIESGYDYLEIFDGTSTAAPSLGVFDSGNIPGTIEATNSEGALTFRFNSDFSITEPGWEANISTVVSKGSFFSDGERSYTTQGYVVNSANGILQFDLATDGGFYPDGTEIEVQYSTDSVTFTTLTEIDLNSVAGSETIIFDQWTNDVVSNSTYFRFVQKGNNGQNLNGWSIENILISVNSNIINGDLFNYTSWGDNNPFFGPGQLEVSAPDIELDVYNILANGEVFPGATIDLSYAITDGAFPAGTEIEGIFERQDLDYDIILGSSSTLNGTLESSIPAVVTGNYTVYVTANGAESNTISLPISGIDIQIDSIVGNPTVLFQGVDYVYPGSEITSYYTIFGTPGTGVELLLKVEDATLGEYITVGTESSFNGSISATLPDSIDYSGNYQLVLSDGQQLLGNTTFLVQYFDNTLGNDLDNDVFLPGEGNGGNFRNEFYEGTQRSIATYPLDVELGARVELEYLSQSYQGSPYDIKLQASTDGEVWTTFQEQEINANGTFNFNELVPVSLLSDSTRFRVIYNEDVAFNFSQNEIFLFEFNVQVPERSDLALAQGAFNILLPELDVETIVDANSLVVGEEITIDFNMTGPFPADTYLAAVIENSGSGEYVLIGEAEATEIGQITGTLPLTIETMGGTGSDYDQIKLVPYIKATAETEYQQGLNIDVGEEDDFLVLKGNSIADFLPNPGDVFYAYFNIAGNRSVLTKAYDLSGVDNASIEFGFYDLDNSFDMDGNLNVVPRLQVSIDAGATFQEIPINTTNEDVGLLFESDGAYSVPIPSQYLTEATHFRWVQPLNLGLNENEWEIDGISIELGENNSLQSFYNSNNVNQGVTLNAPSTAEYLWAQSDLTDPVFNGESFGFSWDIDPEADTTLIEDFPAGTEFVFTLAGETDPDTGEDVIIATASELGVGSAEIPLYVGNGPKTVNLTAFIQVEGEDYFYHEDENVGTIDVFNQVLKTTFDGNANEVYYAGNEVTINYAFENDVESITDFGDLQYNLILLYDSDNDTNDERWLLAVDESLTGSFTVDMPPFVNGTVDFVVEASVGGPLGTIGETLENSGIDLDVAESWINEEVALVDDNNLPGGTAAELASVSGRRVLTTTDFDLVAENSARLSFDLTVSDGFGLGPIPIELDDVLEDQQLIFEYSTDGGATYTELETFFTEGDQDGLVPINIPRNYVLDGDILTASTRFRFRQEESRFTILIENMTISEEGAAQIDFVSAGEGGFVPSISQQSIQITSIDADEACVSDEVTLNYEIRGKFGADNKVMVEYGDGADLRADVINVAANELNSLLGQNNATTGSYPVEFTKDNSSQRRVITDYFDISGGTAGEVTIDVSTLSTLNNDLVVAIETFSTFRNAGFINSGGVSTFTLNANELTSNTRIYIRQFGNPLEGEDVWTLNGIQFDIFGAVSVEGYEFEVTEGSGSVAVQLPTSLFEDGDSNKDLRFRLLADDDTFEGINQDYEVTGSFNEVQVEVVAPINQNATFNTTEPLECNSEDVIATINGMQDYFLYEIIDADGTVLGSLLNDPEMPMNEINIGQITAATDLELRVSSQSSNGTVCNTAVVDEDDIEVLANFELYSKLDVDQSWKLVQAEASLNSCNGAGEVELSARRLLADGSTTTNNASVEWFRDNLNNLVSTDVSIDDSDMELSGEYFARVTTGTCVYTTEAIQINIEPTPAQPTITVVSGDLAACSSAEPVVLAAPEGFAFYRWNNAAASSTRTITVEDGGSYSVEVSNLPFVNGCFSPASATVDVDRYETPELSLRDGTSINSSLIADGAEIEACESYTVFFFEDNSYGNDGNLEVIKDGASYATLESDDSYTIEEDGTYSFVWSYDAINVDGCTTTSNEFTVSLIDAPTTAPTLAADGELNFCEGEGTVTLTAPEGFAYYTWRRNGNAINSTTNGFGSSNVIEVSTDGIYTVTVANSTDGCESPRSNGIDVNVVAEPSIPGLNQVNATCGDGAVEFEIENNNLNAMTYQLYNGETGEVSGNPVTIQNGQSGSIFTDVLTENGIPFYVEVMYADGTGCSNVDPSETETAEVKTISLEVQGSTLIANYDMSEGHDVRWFRNDVLLANAAGSSLTINDAAAYVIEVEYDNGCVITASSADIAGKVLGNQDAMAMQVVSYPNPTLSDVTLNVNSQYMGKHEVIVTSMTGQIMMQSSFEKSSFEAEHAMDVANLEEGIYNVQIRHDGLTQNVRIIKK